MSTVGFSKGDSSDTYTSFRGGGILANYNKDSTRYFSSKQEEYIAKLINGRTVSNSGAAKFTCGDVISDDFIIECKTKMKPSESFSIKKQWLIDSEYERISARKAHNALCFSFGENEPNYFVLSEKEFLKYVELLREGSYND